MGNVLAVNQLNDEYWNNPTKPTILGEFIADVLKKETSLQLQKRACCTGQSGRAEPHAGIKVSIANIGITDNKGGYVTVRGPKENLTNDLYKKNLKIEADDAIHKLDPTLSSGLFFFPEEKRNTGVIIPPNDDKTQVDIDTNMIFQKITETFVGNEKVEFANTQTLGGLSNPASAKKHDFTSDDQEYNYYGLGYKTNNASMYTRSGLNDEIGDGNEHLVISERFMEANKLPTENDPNGKKRLSMTQERIKVNKLPEMFHPNGFVVKKVSFASDDPKEACDLQGVNFDIAQEGGVPQTCDDFYNTFCEEKVSSKNEEFGCMNTDGSFDSTNPACLVNAKQPGIFADDLTRTALFTYPEDCSCINSSDSVNMNSGKALGERYKLETVKKLKDAEKIDRHSNVGSNDAKASPYTTDKFCMDRSGMKYVEVNAANSEYGQPAYVLSKDRAENNIPIDYSLPDKPQTKQAANPVTTQVAEGTAETAEEKAIEEVETTDGTDGTETRLDKITNVASTRRGEVVGALQSAKSDPKNMTTKELAIIGGIGVVALLVVYFVVFRKRKSRSYVPQ